MLHIALMKIHLASQILLRQSDRMQSSNFDCVLEVVVLGLNLEVVCAVLAALKNKKSTLRGGVLLSVIPIIQYSNYYCVLVVSDCNID